MKFLRFQKTHLEKKVPGTTTTTQIWEYVGSSEPLVLIVGQSNSTCIRQAIQSGYKNFDKYYSSIGLKPGMPWHSVDKNYWDLASVSGAKHLCISWDGSQVNTAFLFEPDMSIFPVEQMGINTHSISLVKEFFSENLLGLRIQLKEIMSVSNAKIHLLGTPAPKSDFLVKKGLSKEQYFLDKLFELRTSVDKVKLTNIQVRVELWKILQECLKDVAVDFMIDFIPFPAEALTNESILLEKFSAEDATHANSDLGKLFLDEINAHVGIPNEK